MGGGWSHNDGSMPLSPLLAGEAQSWKSRATENPGWEGEGASGEACGKCLCVCLSITLEEIWCWDPHLREEMTTLLKQGWDVGVASSPQHLIWSRSLQWLQLLEELEVSPRVTCFCVLHSTGGKGTQRGGRCQEKGWGWSQEEEGSVLHGCHIQQLSGKGKKHGSVEKIWKR